MGVRSPVNIGWKQKHGAEMPECPGRKSPVEICTQKPCVYGSYSTVCQQRVRKASSSYSCHCLKSRPVHVHWSCCGEAKGAVGRAPHGGDPHAEYPPCWRHWSITPLLTENAGANNGRDDICERGEILPPTTPSLPRSGDAAPGSCGGSRCGPPPVSCLLLHHHPHANRR